MFCSNCGKEIAENSIFCSSCGAELRKYNLGTDQVESNDTKPELNKDIEKKTPVIELIKPSSFSVSEPELNKDIEEKASVIESIKSSSFSVSEPELNKDIEKKAPVIESIKPSSFSVSEEGCLSFISGSIQSSTTYAGLSSFLEGANPAKSRWAVIIVASLIGLFIIPPLGCIIGFILSYLATILWYSGKSAKLSLVKYYYPADIPVDIDDLSAFLETNLKSLPFTQWQRGRASILTDTLISVDCFFEKKMYHRILFDKDNPGQYKVTFLKASTKEDLKNGGFAGPAAIYKQNYRAQKILTPAIEYYFMSKK